MADGALSHADRQGVLQRVRNVGFGTADGCEGVATVAGDRRGDRGGERAARAVGVGRVDGFGAQDFEAIAVEPDIHAALRPCHRAAFNQHGFGPEGVNLSRGLLHRLQVYDIDAGEDLGFVAVGRDDRGGGNNAIAQGGNGVVVDQHYAGARHHHRIDH